MKDSSLEPQYARRLISEMHRLHEAKAFNLCIDFVDHLLEMFEDNPWLVIHYQSELYFARKIKHEISNRII